MGKRISKGEFYLADSLNEMDIPLNDDPEIAKKELSTNDEADYKPIRKANLDAVWVIQGWTFPYHHDRNGKMFWTPEIL